MFSAQLAARRIIEQNRGGSIVMVASLSAHTNTPSRCMSVYAASKGGIKAATQSMAAELAPFGIRVNSISPGYISTEMVLDHASKDKELWSVVNTAPALRRVGHTTDLKGVVAYLLTDSSAYTTGTDIRVDGGM